MYRRWSWLVCMNPMLKSVTSNFVPCMFIWECGSFGRDISKRKKTTKPCLSRQMTIVPTVQYTSNKILLRCY